MLRKLSFALALFVVIGLNAAAQDSQPHTPRRGDPERQDIMDAMRVPIRKVLKKDVIFKIDELKVMNGWAFVRGVPKNPDGSAMDYSGTVYQASKNEGAFDDWFCALLRKRGDRWQVIKYSIGATDVVYDGWDQEFHAPSAIFKSDQ